MGLDSVELILKIEDEFNISISDKEAGKIRTLGDLYTHVFNKCVSSKSIISSDTIEDVSRRINRILIDNFGIKAKEISPNAEIVRDLGLN